MGKKRKKIRIPKNKDIEELIEQEENGEKIESMEEIIAQIDDKKQEFKDRINAKEEQNKKIKNMCARKDAQVAEEKRRVDLLKAMSELEESQENEER